jgi:hypothetical protein
VFGVDMTFLVEKDHPDGRFGVLEYISKPGLEQPPHWHELIIRSPQLRAVCVIQPSGGGTAFRILGFPKNGAERQPTESTYASAMMDRTGSRRWPFGLAFRPQLETRLRSMPHFQLSPLK